LTNEVLSNRNLVEDFFYQSYRF